MLSVKSQVPSTKALVAEYRSLEKARAFNPMDATARTKRRTAIHKTLTQRFGADEATRLVGQVAA